MKEQSIDPGAALNRRRFLQYSAAATGGLAIAIALPACSDKPSAAAPATPRTVAANAWLRIGTDERISFLCDRAEMGQGVYTALPTLLAEELGVPLARIEVEFAPPGKEYVNDLLGTQITGGSTSVRDAWLKLRRAGAQAREMLVAAACQQWDIPVAGCRVEDGVIISPHGKRLSFGAVAEAAAKLPVPADPVLRARKDFTQIGRAQRRLDTPLKVDGSAVYGIDVRLPDMLYAALLQPPELGARLATLDDVATRALPGIREVVRSSSGVVVVADSWWRARKGRDALKASWSPGANARLDNATISAGLHKAAAQAGQVARHDGDAESALAAAARGGGKVVRAEYELPLLAHATLEPQNCTARVTADACEIWAPTQVQLIAQATAAKAAGIDSSRVQVHTTFLGGGFGRRLEVDYIPAAVEAAKAVGKPVKLLWTREDDMTHDAYRPPAFDQASAAFDAQGKLSAWKLHLTGPSITARMFPGVVEKAIDPFAIEAAANYPYDVPNVLVDYTRHEVGIDVGYWRSVSHALNCFVAESFMDELAAAAGKDPGQFRLELLAKQPRHRAVLDTVMRDAHFGRPPAGRFQGLAVMEGYGTYMAMVAEVAMEGGKVRVHHVWCALDCGQVVNPSIVTAQVESSVIFGLSAALWGDITLRNGRVQQQNFHQYRLLRLQEIPHIDVDILDSGEAPGGIGEPATALIAPALCNAVYAATKKRIRSLPLARHGYA
ncbi:MAG: molybdopterin cofactor-binding domain-containing protein [Steroidobacteraceae bacterium]